MRIVVRANRFIVVVMLLSLVLLPQVVANAQEAPGLTITGEFSLGDYCPVEGTISPDGSVVWVLLDDCIGEGGVLVQGFHVADGTPVGEPIGPFDMEISGDDLSWMDWPIMALQDDGTLTLDFVDTMETGTTASFTVDTATGAITSDPDSPRILTENDILATFPGFTGYPSFRYTDDRSLALTRDDESLLVFDVAGGQEVMRVAPPGGLEYVGSWFGENGNRLYAWTMEEPGNYDNRAGTLYTWDIPAGDLVSATDYPIAPDEISPDERFAVVSTVPCCDHENLAVMDLATMALSESFPAQPAIPTLSICKNTGRPASNYDWSGNPSTVGKIWLPDNSGFVTLHSLFFWQGSCKSNESWMRVYSVTGS
ncbi:MAG: hypothetical protein U0452_07295 [Anaerolineae bacterium]